MIKLIWAQTPNGIIGNESGLPWKLPEEMRHFRNTTLNQDILMGRKTFASLGYRPLPKRFNYILTRDTILPQGEHYQYLNRIEPLIAKYGARPNHDLYIIGGKEIIELFFAHADTLIVSITDQEFSGTIKLENLDWNIFKLVGTEKHKDFTIHYWAKK